MVFIRRDYGLVCLDPLYPEQRYTKRNPSYYLAWSTVCVTAVITGRYSYTQWTREQCIRYLSTGGPAVDAFRPLLDTGGLAVDAFLSPGQVLRNSKPTFRYHPAWLKSHSHCHRIPSEVSNMVIPAVRGLFFYLPIT